MIFINYTPSNTVSVDFLLLLPVGVMAGYYGNIYIMVICSLFTSVMPYICIIGWTDSRLLMFGLDLICGISISVSAGKFKPLLLSSSPVRV